MAMPIEMAKPNVRVLMSPDASPAALRQLTYGMEEEGIPWEEGTKEGMDALALSWRPPRHPAWRLDWGWTDNLWSCTTPNCSRTSLFTESPPVKWTRCEPSGPMRRGW